MKSNFDLEQKCIPQLRVSVNKSALNGFLRHLIILVHHTVDSRYLEIEGTLKNSSRYPYFDISDL